MLCVIGVMVSLVAQGASSFGLRLNAALEALVAPTEPGIAVCAIADGKVIHAAARGLADLERREPLTTSTPVYLASVSKAFTTVAVLRLIEQQRFGLDDSIVTLVADLPDYLRPVTVRHLLTHTSGIPDPGEALAEGAGVTNADVMTFVRSETALKFPAGSRWSYSNTGFVLLAELVGRSAGRSLAEFLTAEFFVPLQMTSTFVHTPETRSRPRAIGYKKENGAWVKDDYGAYTVGPGGIYASADDMCRWGLALDGGRLLKRMTLIATYTPHVTSGATPTPMGLGFQVEDIPKGALAGQWYAAMFGTRNGFRAVDMLIKDRAFRYVQLSNSSRTLEPVMTPNLFFEAAK